MTDVAIAPLTVGRLRAELEKKDLVCFPATLADYDKLSDYQEFSLNYVQK